MKKRIHFPLWIVYGIPVFLWAYTYFYHIYNISNGLQVYREYGFIENVTDVMLLIAIILFLVCLKKVELFWEKLWLLVLAAGAIYFLGEEISWGYHLFHYHVSDEWVQLNCQKEPNLHNLPGIYGILFDKLPRQLLSIGVIIGGILGVIADRRDSWPNNILFRRLIPSGETLFVAVAASVVTVPEKILEHIWAETPKWFILGNAGGELKEGFLAFFIMLYAYGLFRIFSHSSGNGVVDSVRTASPPDIQ
ncbi:MAG: hypothetical protein A4E66_00287 [Syntrophus sp. PtaB.Bin001]|nr:MAG: hypothetical protein A4E66_00287 [Syntrophus sp. PtaB.Bin001]